MFDGNKVVSVFGSGKFGQGHWAFALAEKVGSCLAGRGFAVATGGYGGTMLAVSKGASRGRVPVIGVTCSFWADSKANEFVSKEIVTDSLSQRLDKLIELGDAYVVLPGGTGTLQELGRVWECKRKGVAGADKPILLVGDFWEPVVNLMARADGRTRRCVTLIGDVEELGSIDI